MLLNHDIITIISKYIGFCIKCKKNFETCLWCSQKKCFCDLSIEDQEINGYLCSKCISNLKKIIFVHKHHYEFHL